jgi:phage tail sheath protein FI
MAFQLSPGVNVSEVDLTTVVPSVATTIGGFAGNFAWGPIGEIVAISNEIRLAETFGKPDSNTFTQFFTASNFLAYGSDLRVVRSAGAGANNATSSGTGKLIKNQTEYELNYSSGSTTDTFYAKWAGALGSSITVSISDSNTHNDWAYANNFSSAPGDSEYALSKGSFNDELHIIVLDRTGIFTGVQDSILEKFAFVSKASDAKNSDGSSNYYKDVINSRSKYIWWAGHNADARDANSNGSIWGTSTTDRVTYKNLTASIDYDLSGGKDDAPSDSNLNTSYDLFQNPDSTDVSLLLAGKTTGSTVPNHLIALAESRKDCLVFVSPEQNDVVNNSGSEATDILLARSGLTSSSYAFMDSGYKYQYDKYNDTYRWIPLNGDIAGLCVRTDNERDPWFSPAGLNRGIIKNVVKLAWNPTRAERDELYKKGVNPVVTFPGEGTILYGDKTLLSRPSAFDRINVRRLFIVLEKSIARASRSSLFEFNDEFTRAQFINLVEPYLRDVQGRRGIFDFRVVCDETNNTPEIVDRNEFVGDIYIKPARSINFIQLNFVATRTGVSFDEVVGQF